MANIAGTLRDLMPWRGSSDSLRRVTRVAPWMMLGPALEDATRATVRAFAGGPHVFNLGHGITPEADPANVERMLKAIRDP